MVNIVCGFAVFLMSFIVSLSVLMFGPDAGFTALQGSALLFVGFVGMFSGMAIINRGEA